MLTDTNWGQSLADALITVVIGIVAAVLAYLWHRRPADVSIATGANTAVEDFAQWFHVRVVCKPGSWLWLPAPMAAPDARVSVYIRDHSPHDEEWKWAGGHETVTLTSMHPRLIPIVVGNLDKSRRFLSGPGWTLEPRSWHVTPDGHHALGKELDPRRDWTFEVTVGWFHNGHHVYKEAAFRLRRVDTNNRVFEAVPLTGLHEGESTVQSVGTGFRRGSQFAPEPPKSRDD